MTNNNHAPDSELSYYGLSFRFHLLDNHPHLARDRAFIARRSDNAAGVYSTAIHAGLTHVEAEELATRELYRGLHFSAYNTLVNILWDEFPAEIPEDKAKETALRVLPHCSGVLAKYTLTDDFADTPQYDLLYTELTGSIQILLEDGTIY